jgi:DNA-binding CsgD family transcriptional regulator
VIEDIHWADDGSLLLLRHVLPSIASQRLLIVATYRTDEVLGLERLAPHLTRLVRDRTVHHIALEPLAPPAVRRLTRLALGENARLPEPALEGIVERSEGNPFFAEELLKNALENVDGNTWRELPRTVRATVLERVSGLASQERDVVLRAAVLGRRFDANLLSNICGLELRELLLLLRKFRNLELIDEIADAELWYAFRHALTQEAIYSELLAAEAKLIHARVLTELEARGDAGANALGYHAWAAGDRVKSVIHNEGAGDQAIGLHAYGEALKCYLRAVEFASQPDDRGRLLTKAADCCARDGKAAQAIEFYGDALGAYRGTGRTKAFAATYQAMSAQARIAGDNQRGTAIVEEALAELPPDDSLGRALIGANLAFMRLDRGDLESARTLIAESIAARGTPEYQNLLQYEALVAGDVARFGASAVRHLESVAPQDSFNGLRARFNVAFGFTILGADDAALAEFEEILPQLREHRLSSLEMLSTANCAIVHARKGNLPVAKSLIDRAAELPEPSSTGPIVLAAAALIVGFALWDEELVARCCSSEIVEAAFSSNINSTLGRIAGPYARWLHALRKQPEAQSILRRAVEALKAPFGATDTFIAAAELGDEATRARAYAVIDVLDGMAGAPIYAATSAHLRALHSFGEGDKTASIESAQKAFAEYVKLGWPMHQAQCLELIGDSKRASIRYRRLGAVGPSRRPNNVAKTQSPWTAALSQREREIASLVAFGTVNKDIAQRLALNQRTVEKHLTSIYGKLGVRNRSELAAFIARGPA